MVQFLATRLWDTLPYLLRWAADSHQRCFFRLSEKSSGRCRVRTNIRSAQTAHSSYLASEASNEMFFLLYKVCVCIVCQAFVCTHLSYATSWKMLLIFTFSHFFWMLLHKPPDESLYASSCYFCCTTETQPQHLFSSYICKKQLVCEAAGPGPNRPWTKSLCGWQCFIVRKPVPCK